MAEIGEFTLHEENLARMRDRRLRDPGIPSGAVEHAFDSQLPGTAIAQRANRVMEDWLEARLHPEP